MSRHHTQECLTESTVLGLMEGQLEGVALADVEAHLAECEDCLMLVGAVAQGRVTDGKDAPPDVRDAPVSLHDRYEMVGFIAAGGMGQVYAAVDRHTGQRVAIKSLEEGEGEQDAALLARFAREGEALRRLDHPNIVKLLEVIASGDQLHIVMEYVAGGSLRDLIRRGGPLPSRRALLLLLEVADGLSRAHHLGILHRDIKPANVLLAEDGTARLSDFGLARMGDTHLTQTGTLLGTVPYLSPEALWGQPLDARADLWSLGVTLFEMLSADLPFAGDTHGSIVTAILHQPTPDLSARHPGTPAALVELLNRMLEKDPARRIASARQVGAIAEALLRDLGEAPADLRRAVSARDTAGSNDREPTGSDTLAVAVTPALVVAATSQADLGLPPRAALGAADAPRKRSTHEAVPPPPVSHSSASVRALEFPGPLATPGLPRLRAGWAALLLLGVCGAVWLAFSARRASVNQTVVAQAEQFARTSPPPLAVDDFEDGDLVPRDPRFARWQRYHYNSSGPSPVYAGTAPPGTGSNQCLRLAWLVRDALNGKSDFAGAGVRTLASNVFVDLSQYSRLVFIQRYQGDAAFPSGWTAARDKVFEKLPPQADRESLLLQGIEKCSHRRPTAFVQLFCAEYNTSVEVEFPLSDDWQTVVIPFSSLHESYWKPPTHTPLASCLAVIDGVSFIVQDNQLADGECHSGSLWLDDISFR